VNAFTIISIKNMKILHKKQYFSLSKEVYVTLTYEGTQEAVVKTLYLQYDAQHIVTE